MTPPPVLSWSAQLVSSLGMLRLILRKTGERQRAREGWMKGEKGKREVGRERDRRKETRLLGSSTNEKYNILMLPLIFFILKYFWIYKSFKDSN